MMKAFKEAFQQQHLILSLGLGLFIFLAGGQSLTSAWMMTLALFFNLFLSSVILYFLKRYFTEDNKWILIMVVMASVATWFQMLSIAYLPGWVQGIEVYLPFIAISGLILARVETVVQTESLPIIFFHMLGSVVGFAMLVLPIGLLSDGLGLGVITFASPSGQGPLFSMTILDVAYRMPIFFGPQGAIGVLILAALWIALVRQLRGKQA
jgi:Na+-translocating ferredoxin:NAD+ oxidoreductase RnfE subunit